MAQQSAKRFGLEVEGDLELENRLRRMEVAIAALSPANQDAVVTSRGSGAVPQVTGLSLDGQIPGGFTVKWNATTIPDLRRYQVQFATDLAFADDLQTFSVAAISYPFTTKVGNTLSYFCRVRAQNNAGQVGPYSVTLNTTTGTVGTDDIDDNAVTDPKIESTEVASGRVTGFLTGCKISNNSSDSVNDIDFAIGAARDFADTITITPSTTQVKQIDAIWSAGSGSGGLASGSTPVSADTWYHCFLLSSSEGTTIDAGFDTEITASSLLSDSGLTQYRRVGSIFTNGSSGILGFLQLDGFFQFNDPIQDIDLTNPGTAERIHQLTSLPPDIQSAAHLSLNWRPASNNNWSGFVQYGPIDANFDTVPGSDDNDGGPRGDGRVVHHSAVIICDSTRRIKTRQSGNRSDLHLYIQVHGWNDSRGVDGGL